MRATNRLLRRPVAAGLIFLFALPLAQAAPQQEETGTPPQSSLPIAPSPSAPGQAAQSEVALAEPAQQQQAPPLATRDQNAPADSGQSGTGKPLGTAAAPLEKTTGVAASRPAGAVIAPAKQRRARSIIIRVGVVLGAAAAVAAVVGLSKASPARP
jgi:hypothetical protein